jgi:hypothetical protein
MVVGEDDKVVVVGDGALCVSVAVVWTSLVSVRKVVPTLTSKSVEIYLSMAGAKQHNDTGLSWFRPWVVRPTGVRSGRCIAVHRGACRGELQAKQERRRSLHVTEV